MTVWEASALFQPPPWAMHMAGVSNIPSRAMRELVERKSELGKTMLAIMGGQSLFDAERQGMPRRARVTLVASLRGLNPACKGAR